MNSLKGKTALITGAGRGIGRATAIALAKEGVNLGLLGLNMPNLEKAAAELVEVKVSIATGDVSNLESVINAVERIKADHVPIDILINNAGVAKFGGFLDLTPEEWEELYFPA